MNSIPDHSSRFTAWLLSPRTVTLLHMSNTSPWQTAACCVDLISETLAIFTLVTLACLFLATFLHQHFSIWTAEHSVLILNTQRNLWVCLPWMTIFIPRLHLGCQMSQKHIKMNRKHWAFCFSDGTRDARMHLILGISISTTISSDLSAEFACKITEKVSSIKLFLYFVPTAI